MKVAFVTNGLFPVPAAKGGGAETLVQNLLDQNEIYHKADFIVYSLYDEEAQWKSVSYRYTSFHFIPRKKWGIKDAYFLLKHLLKKKILGFTVYRPIYDFKYVYEDIQGSDIDYIIVENTLVPFQYLVDSYGEKVFIHVHNELFKESYPIQQRKLLGETVNKSAGVIAVSDYIRRYSLQMGYMENAQFQILMNAVDVSKFKQIIDKNNDSFLKDIAIDEDDYSFVYFGRICEEKGVTELIKSFSRIKDKKVRLFIIGAIEVDTDDSYSKDVLNLIRKDERVNLTGYVDHDDMWKILSIMDCAVLPSRCQDSCPLTIIESMAAGLPIISTKTGGIPEEVDDKCAILLDNDSKLEQNLYRAMVYLSTNADVSKKMSDASEIRVSVGGAFDLKNYYDRFIDILRSKSK